MPKIIEMVNLTNLKKTLKADERHIVIIPCDFLGGVFVCLLSAELANQLAKLPDWKKIKYMKNDFPIRIWASRFPCQPQFFVRSLALEIVGQIKILLNVEEVEFLPLPIPKKTCPA